MSRLRPIGGLPPWSAVGGEIAREKHMGWFDGAHLNQAGYRLQTKRIVSTLCE
jgi:hypothetical protein